MVAIYSSTPRLTKYIHIEKQGQQGDDEEDLWMNCGRSGINNINKYEEEIGWERGEIWHSRPNRVDLEELLFLTRDFFSLLLLLEFI